MANNLVINKNSSNNEGFPGIGWLKKLFSLVKRKRQIKFLIIIIINLNE